MQSPKLGVTLGWDNGITKLTIRDGEHLEVEADVSAVDYGEGRQAKRVVQKLVGSLESDGNLETLREEIDIDYRVIQNLE